MDSDAVSSGTTSQASFPEPAAPRLDRAIAWSWGARIGAALLLALAVASFQLTSASGESQRRRLESEQQFSDAMYELGRSVGKRTPEESEAMADRFDAEELELQRRQTEDARRSHAAARRALPLQTAAVAAVAGAFLLVFARFAPGTTTASRGAGPMLAVSCLVLYTVAASLPAIGGMGSYHGHPQDGVYDGHTVLVFGAMMIPDPLGLVWLANVAGAAGIVAAALRWWRVAFLLGSVALLVAIAAPLVLVQTKGDQGHVLSGFYAWVATFALLAAGSARSRRDAPRPA